MIEKMLQLANLTIWEFENEHGKDTAIMDISKDSEAFLLYIAAKKFVERYG